LPLDNLAAYLVSHYGADHASPEKFDAQEKSDNADKTEKHERAPVSTTRG